MIKLRDMIVNMAAKSPTKTAVIFDDSRISYQALDDMVIKAAEYLSDRQVRSGHEVLLMMDNSVEFVVLLLAILRIEAVAFLLPPSLKVDEFLGITKHNEIDACVIADQSSPEILELVKTSCAKVISCHYENGVVFKMLQDKEMVAGNKPSDYVLRMISSGSTGQVKQMLRAGDSLIYMCEVGKDLFNLNEDDVFLSFVPPIHIMGVAQVFLVLYNNATLLLEKTFIPSRILADIEKYRATWMMASPFVLDILALSVEPGKNNLSSMRLAISSSGPLPQRTYENFRARCGIPLHEIYGSTECTIVTAEIDDGIFKPNVVGRPVKGVKVKIVDNHFNELPLGEIGNVATASPMAVTEYQNNQEATSEAFINGFVLVGDRGFIDDAGQLHIVGRNNDVINVAGKKVDPVEVEHVLLNYPGVKDAAVYGVDDGSTQVVKAFIVKSSDIDLDELKGYCQSKLSDYKIPRDMAFIEALPRNKTGKLMRKQLSDEG